MDLDGIVIGMALTNDLFRQALETAFLLAGFMKGEEVRKEQKNAREMSI